MEFFGRHQHHPSGSATPEDKDYIPPQPDAVCLHTELIPTWNSVADMGQEDKVVAYHCEACRKTFTPAEVQALRSDEAERVRSLIEPAEGDEAGAQEAST
jgi:hypothetical protein